jgi:hypothetical protein
VRLGQVRFPAVIPLSVLPSPRIPWQPLQFRFDAGTDSSPIQAVIVFPDGLVPLK